MALIGFVGFVGFVEFVEFIGEHDHEILTVKWVDPYNLPPLSHKVTKHEVERMINAALHDKTIFD